MTFQDAKVIMPCIFLRTEGIHKGEYVSEYYKI